MTTKIVEANFTIAFSAGIHFSKCVEKCAADWDVTPSEVCRRLAVMAGLCLDIRHHGVIARLTVFCDDRQQKFASTAFRCATVIAAEEQRLGRELTQQQKYKALVVLAKHNEETEAAASVEREGFDYD